MKIVDKKRNFLKMKLSIIYHIDERKIYLIGVLVIQNVFSV